MGGKKWRWGVILDAGSSGTRLHIYKWKDPARVLNHASPEKLHRLPKLKTEKDYTKKIRPGVSTFGDKPDQVGPDHLQGLIDHALAIIPKDMVNDTPIFLMATAGMRLLPQSQQTALVNEICSYLQKNTQFSLPDCGLHIQVIKGETEGLYGWIASNYLLGGFDHPEDHAHGKNHHTYGFLDMGGASAQIAFAPNATEAEKHANDLKLLRLRTMDGAPHEYKVFTTTWLGFGVHQARESYVKSLEEAYGGQGAKELPEPCLPRGLRTTLSGDELSTAANNEVSLVGTGAFDECLRKTYPLLGKEKPCSDHPCLLNGQHVPAIDFDVNHFVGVSEYWHTTHGIFGVKGDKAYDFVTYQQRVKQVCDQDWSVLKSKVVNGDHDAKEVQDACFKASWLINVLHEGIGIPRYGVDKTPEPGLNASKGAVKDAQDNGLLEPFHPADKIHGIEVSWTLGKMLLYASGQVPPIGGDNTKPVGFGSNEPGIPADFNYAGSVWTAPTPGTTYDNDDDDDDGWSDTAEDILDKAKSKQAHGFLLLILILVILAYIFRKRDRRMRLFAKTSSLFRRSRRPGSPRKASGPRGLSGLTNKLFGRGGSATYERVLEEGEADQFELGDVDDESDQSEASATSSSASRHGGRSSGLATPNVNAEVKSGFSALDRSGLVVRTESRERLVVPSGLNLNLPTARSRGTSPTRMKSPLMRAVAED